MGAVEDAVDAAAKFIGPFLDRSWATNERLSQGEHDLDADQIVDQALSHLQGINTADQAKDPDAPYDGSLVGVVYGLVDLITSLGILPFLSPGVAFSQRPRSVLVVSPSISPSRNDSLLSKVLTFLIPISEQEGSGVHPLLAQRALPDILSGVAELAFSPRTGEESHRVFQPQYEKILASTSTSRLLPILTSFLQQDVPPWLRQRLSKELALVPLRPHGVRHTVEFLSLSYLSKSAQMPQEAGDSLSQIPIPLEAITQTSKLLSSVPSVMDSKQWFTQLAPQLWELLDVSEGVELSRAAGQIIAGGILNRKSTGAPGTIGWELFARPILQTINPGNLANTTLRNSTSDQVIIKEQHLKLALKRLSVIATAYSHPGLIKRLIGPVLLPLWGLMCYAKSRPSLEKDWTQLPRSIIGRYISIACDPKQIDIITTNIFWGGESSWTFGPGSQGGVELRRQSPDNIEMADIGNLFSHIGNLDERVSSLVSLLVDANIDDETAGQIFVHTTKRWLSAGQMSDRPKLSLTNEEDPNPLNALADAKLSEAMATKFKDKFARCPQHIIELMAQLLGNFVEDHKAQSKKKVTSHKVTRAAINNIIDQQIPAGAGYGTDMESEDLVSFALSIFNALITSDDLKLDNSTFPLFSSVTPYLQYLSQPHQDLPLPPLITNASTNLLQLLQPRATTSATQHDSQAGSRLALKSALADLTSPEPPNRAWALSTLRKLILDPSAFPLIDIPSTTHLLLSASIADPESYVHTAAIPVLVDLAIRVPNPTLRITIDAFVDIDEHSLRLKKEEDIVQALDFRLRTGEVLNEFVVADEYWIRGTNLGTRHQSLKMILEAILSIASRRGQRKKTLSKRAEIAKQEQKEQEEGEAAWGGPIPNLLDPEGENSAEQYERDALLKIVQGWEDTGIEEDVRIRSSALSILSIVMEERLELLGQITVDAGLQMVLQILIIETGVAKAILRRAAVLVIMGLLRGMATLLEEGKESAAGLGMKQSEEVERIVKWVRDEDRDELVRGHAENVVEGLETWKMKKLFKIGDEQFKLNADLGLEGNLRGLDVKPTVKEDKQVRRGPFVEEIE